MKKGEKTKRHIYECAIELFRTKGYDKVSVDEIVKCAGTAKGTFYIYFETKADVLIYMLKAYDDYYDKVASGFLPEMGVEERLLVITQSSSEFTENVMGRDVIRVLYSNQLMEQGNEIAEGRHTVRASGPRIGTCQRRKLTQIIHPVNLCQRIRQRQPHRRAGR